MIGLICFLLLLFCGVADAQIVSPVAAPPVVVGGTSLPNGGPPQIIGYSAANTTEAETVGGDFTFARTGSSQYTATITKLNGVAVGALATLNVGTGLSVSSTNLNLTTPVAIASGGTGTITAPLVGQILIAQTTSAYGPMPVGGDVSMTTNGLFTVSKINGTVPGGTCSASQFVTTISSSGVPSCAAPSITPVPNGNVPQFVGYSAANSPEAETLGGGAGACTFSRTGANAYQLTCNYAPTASPTFTGTVTMPDAATWTSSGITGGTSATFSSVVSTQQLVASSNVTLNTTTASYNAVSGAVYNQPGYVSTGPAGQWTVNGFTQIPAVGIGQAIGADPLDITDNVNGAAYVTLLNNSSGTTASASFQLTNGTKTARFTLNGTGASSNANNLIIWSDNAVVVSSHNSQQEQFQINGTLMGYFATNGLHLQVAPLEVASGGLGNATAPSVGQVPVATSATVYTPTTLAAASLSDYSSGSWTPVLAFGGNSVGITYSAQGGAYVKVGNLVSVSIVLVLTSKGTSTGGATVTLPYTARGGISPGCQLGYYYMPGFTGNYPTFDVGGGGALVSIGMGGATTFTGATNANFTGSDNIQFNCTYIM